MKKIISLLIVAVMAFSVVGCSARSKSTPLASGVEGKTIENESTQLILKVQNYDQENDQLKVSEAYNEDQVDYLVYAKDGVTIDLSQFKKGDLVAVEAELIMESYPAQVPAINVVMATEDQVKNALEIGVCGTLDPVEYTNVGYDQLPEEVKNQLNEQSEEATYQVIQTEEGTYLVAYLGMRNTGGYSIEVTLLGMFGDELLFEASEKAPGKDMMVTMAITYPYTVIKLNKKMEQLDKVSYNVYVASENGSSVDMGDKYFIEPLDRFKEGEVIITGELVQIEGEYLHVLSGDLIQVFKGNPDMYQSFYLGETISLVKSGVTFKIESYIEKDFTINHTNMGHMIIAGNGLVKSLDGDQVTLTVDGEDITMTGAESFNLTLGENVDFEYIFFGEDDFFLSSVMKADQWLTLNVKNISRTEEGYMVIDLGQADSEEVTHVASIHEGTVIRLNLSEIKVGDDVEIYANIMTMSLPAQVPVERIRK